MKLTELVASARSGNEQLFEGVSQQQATKIVRAVLQDVASQVDKTDEGQVSVPGLGNFVVRQTEPKDDKPARKRVIYRPAGRRSAAGSRPGARKPRN